MRQRTHFHAPIIQTNSFCFGEICIYTTILYIIPIIICIYYVSICYTDVLDFKIVKKELLSVFYLKYMKSILH